MRFLIILFFLSSCVPIKKNYQKKQNDFAWQPDERKLYLVCRATASKSSLIAKKFNIKDRKITHCGLGFFSKGKFKIYNVSDVAGDKTSSLVIDSYTSFSAIKGVSYVSIWELNIQDFPLHKIKSICNEYQKEKIVFDYDFRVGNDDKFYCSEFCASVLNNANIDEVYFRPTIRKVDDRLYKAFLNRDTLVYFPVDFFQKDRRFKKVYEIKLEK